MSTPKITPKNLSYNTSLPPFLARLQANNANTSGRHEYTIARAKKNRTDEEIADDEPVYFNEETGETLTMGEWEEREKDGEEEKPNVEETLDEEKEEDTQELVKAKEEKVATIGATKKRKVGKVIGGSEDEGEAGAKKPATAKKKAKKVKLSFGDDE
ncbi:hypothetical protein M7I_0137 [Glarea lozoyensis 74030]|uniref:DUF4604 domain-containing protein n=1 Tax=Glarea lozoyensis (strain ATCC 74030 / MF5533) TaxID=1104152 RepID=H0ECJ5_GLAL7|nr:hypothetical protein M7I_0137 [Glarea lozoyensis 74030]